MAQNKIEIKLIYKRKSINQPPSNNSKMSSALLQANAVMGQLLAEQGEKLDRTIQLLSQITSGLYNNYDTQQYILKLHMSFLVNGNGIPECACSKELCICEYERPWPTTRQGDENTDRIKKLEEQVQTLEARVNAMINAGQA